MWGWLLLVSMVDGKLFDTLAGLADRLRKETDRPFGGIQVSLLESVIKTLPLMRYSLLSLVISFSFLRSQVEGSRHSSLSKASRGTSA